MTCTKHQFATKDAALASLRGRTHTRRQRLQSDVPPLTVYRCQSCGDWHIGHQSAWKKIHRPYRKGVKS